MSRFKNKEDDLRERLNQRGAHAQLIGITKITSSQNESELETVTTEIPNKKRKTIPKRHTLLIEQREEKEKNKFANKYKPVTFYIDKNLLEKFDELTGNGQISGEKTRAINEAISEYLDSFTDK